MKPAAFGYVRPTSVAEACALLAADPHARPIAGGQTLVPMLSMRLARPSQLVDIARIASLQGISVSDGMIEIGAATRQTVVEHAPAIARHAPLLAMAIKWVGHPATRARGTIGGSLANADPAAEIPLVAVALGGDIVIAGVDGDQVIPARGFFVSAMTTRLPAGCILRALRLPLQARGPAGVGFAEINARASDFAFAAIAAQVTLDAAGRLASLSVAVGGATEVPTLLDLPELIGIVPSATAFAQALRRALADVPMMSDPHASAAYRRRAAHTLAMTALQNASAQAREAADAGHA